MSGEVAPLALRLATFNVENLGDPGNDADRVAERTRLLKPQILRLRADVLCLQEVDSDRAGKGNARRLGALDTLLEGTPYADFHRLATTSRTTGEVRDKHNLVILSRFPITDSRQIHHDLVSPPRHSAVTAIDDSGTRNNAEDGAEDGGGMPVEWDRPFLYAALSLGDSRPLHVLNLHLRAPRAAFVPGQKADSRSWRTMAGWAEGFFLATVKRAGQALETRLFIDRLFDADPDALIVVCGDFNADDHETPVRTIRGDEEDAGNSLLTARTLVPVERSLADSRRFSVVHHGRPQMLDHVLASRPLLAWYRGSEIHNEALGDELITSHAVRRSPESFHAPVVAEFRFEEPPAVTGS